jgi:hypothetical protein
VDDLKELVNILTAGVGAAVVLVLVLVLLGLRHNRRHRFVITDHFRLPGSEGRTGEVLNVLRGQRIDKSVDTTARISQHSRPAAYPEHAGFWPEQGI